MLEAIERGVEGALLHDELVGAHLLDAEEDAVAVELAEGDGFEDEQVEGSLHEVDLFGHCGSLLGRLGGR